MPGRRSVSVEPEDLIVASPRRRSARIAVRTDSPVPVLKKELAPGSSSAPLKRGRRSQSIQETSVTDIEKDVRDVSPLTIPSDSQLVQTNVAARRTRRSASSQETTVSADDSQKNHKPVAVKRSKRVLSKEQAADPSEDETKPESEPDDTSVEYVARKRVTRSMSRSPTNTQKSVPPIVKVFRNRLSLIEKKTEEAKSTGLDIISENENETDKPETISESRPLETDLLNNNAEKEAEKMSAQADNTDKIIFGNVTDESAVPIATEVSGNTNDSDVSLQISELNLKDEEKMASSTVTDEEKEGIDIKIITTETVEVAEKSIAENSQNVLNDNATESNMMHDDSVEVTVAPESVRKINDSVCEVDINTISNELSVTLQSTLNIEHDEKEPESEKQSEFETGDTGKEVNTGTIEHVAVAENEGKDNAEMDKTVDDDKQDSTGETADKLELTEDEEIMDKLEINEDSEDNSCETVNDTEDNIKVSDVPLDESCEENYEFNVEVVVDPFDTVKVNIIDIKSEENDKTVLKHEMAQKLQEENTTKKHFVEEQRNSNIKKPNEIGGSIKEDIRNKVPENNETETVEVEVEQRNNTSPRMQEKSGKEPTKNAEIENMETVEVKSQEKSNASVEKAEDIEPKNALHKLEKKDDIEIHSGKIIEKIKNTFTAEDTEDIEIDVENVHEEDAVGVQSDNIANNLSKNAENENTETAEEVDVNLREQHNKSLNKETITMQSAGEQTNVNIEQQKEETVDVHNIVVEIIDTEETRNKEKETLKEPNINPDSEINNEEGSTVHISTQEVIPNQDTLMNVTSKSEDNTTNISIVFCDKSHPCVDNSEKEDNCETNISIVDSPESNMSSTPIKDKTSEKNSPAKSEHERNLNLSLVNDDGKSYSPIMNRIENISIHFENSSSSIVDPSESVEINEVTVKSDVKNESVKAVEHVVEESDVEVSLVDLELDERKPVNESNTTTPDKSKDSSNEEELQSVVTGSNKEELNESDKYSQENDTTKDENVDPTENVTETENLNKSRSQPAKNTGVEVATAKPKEKSRDQILDEFIESVQADKKRKRQNLDESVVNTLVTHKKRRDLRTELNLLADSDESEIEKPRKQSRKKNRHTIDSSEEYESEEYEGNEFIDDMASEGTEDTPSVDSNEIIDEGESVGSTGSEMDSDDDYEHGSFVVDDDVRDEELLSGSDEIECWTPKRKRIITIQSDSEEEFEKMSTEPFGGSSPSLISVNHISSVDSDMESVRARNEELSKMIEDKAKSIDVEDAENDDLIIVDVSSTKKAEEESKLLPETDEKSGECNVEQQVIEIADEVNETANEVTQSSDMEKVVELTSTDSDAKVEEIPDVSTEITESSTKTQNETVQNNNKPEKDSSELQEIDSTVNETLNELITKSSETENADTLENMDENLKASSVREPADLEIRDVNIFEAKLEGKDNNVLGSTENEDITQEMQEQEIVVDNSTKENNIEADNSENILKQQERDAKYKAILEKYFKKFDMNISKKIRRQTVGMFSDEKAACAEKDRTAKRKRRQSLSAENYKPLSEETREIFETYKKNKVLRTASESANRQDTKELITSTESNDADVKEVEGECQLKKPKTKKRKRTVDQKVESVMDVAEHKYVKSPKLQRSHSLTSVRDTAAKYIQSPKQHNKSFADYTSVSEPEVVQKKNKIDDTESEECMLNDFNDRIKDSTESADTYVSSPAKSKKARKSFNETELNNSGAVKARESDTSSVIKKKKSSPSGEMFEMSEPETETKRPKKKKKKAKSNNLLLDEAVPTTEGSENKLVKKLRKSKKTQIKAQNTDAEFYESESNADKDRIFNDNQANVISNIKRRHHIKLPFENRMSAAEKSSTKVEKKSKRSKGTTTSGEGTNYLREIKENSTDTFIERRNTHLTKAKLLTITKDKKKTQLLTENKFSVKREQAKPSKSEYDLVNEYVALNTNIYKNLIKPSGHGTTSGNMKVEGLRPDSIKIKRHKKKQKYKHSLNPEIPAASLSGQTKFFNFKEELLFGTNVKRVPISYIIQKRSVK